MLLALLGVAGCCQLSVLLGLVERYWELSGDAGGCWEDKDHQNTTRDVVANAGDRLPAAPLRTAVFASEVDKMRLPAKIHAFDKLVCLTLSAAIVAAFKEMVRPLDPATARIVQLKWP
uniref:Secreted protein n=1 Tax=Ascaris lumbricoides TaxID=6252 RepID=A0A0M3HQN2_ASCLU